MGAILSGPGCARTTRAGRRARACCDAGMPKPELEFFPAASIAWAPVSPGVWERVLARDDDGVGLTRMLRWDPGFAATEPAVHDYIEEVYILSGAIYDTTLERTFGAGDYACRPPGMVHGPWTSADGCEMLEWRYAQLR